MMYPVFWSSATLPKSASQIYAAASDEFGVEQGRGGDEAREAGVWQIETEGVAVMYSVTTPPSSSTTSTPAAKSQSHLA